MTLYAVIDFETTGLDPVNDYPIQLGWCIVEDNGRRAFRPKMANAIYILPKMGRDEYYETKAFKVHGIPYSALTGGAKTPKEAYEIFLDKVVLYWTDDEPYYPIIAGHNVHFDFAFLKRLHSLSGVEKWPFDYHLMDVATMGMFFYGVRALASIVRMANIDYDWHKVHDAGVDVDMTAQALIHFLNLKRKLLY